MKYTPGQSALRYFGRNRHLIARLWCRLRGEKRPVLPGCCCVFVAMAELDRPAPHTALGRPLLSLLFFYTRTLCRPQCFLGKDSTAVRFLLTSNPQKFRGEPQADGALASQAQQLQYPHKDFQPNGTPFWRMKPKLPFDGNHQVCDRSHCGATRTAACFAAAFVR